MNLKMLGLASVAAMALMACVGVSSAAAVTHTVLCKATETPHCTSFYGAGTEIVAKNITNTEPTITGDGEFFKETKCKKSTIAGKTESSTTPAGKIATFSFGECTNTIKVLKNGNFQVHHDAEHNGNITVGEYEIEVIAGINCKFGGFIEEGITLTGSGLLPKIAVTVSMKNTGGHFLCPFSATWHAEYALEKPIPLYVGEENV